MTDPNPVNGTGAGNADASPYVRAILDTALDCIIGMDHEGKVCEFNAAAEKTFGYGRSEVIGRELADLIIPPAQREAHRRGLAHFLATGESVVLGRRLELAAMRSDGTEFPVELAITRIATHGPSAFIAYIRDITDRVRAEELRSIRFAVTQQLAHGSNASDAPAGILRAICERMRWQIAFFWHADQEAATLRCIAQWSQDPACTSFAQATCTRTFEKGQGLPGRVWASGRAMWIRDVAEDSNFPRAEAAAAAGVRSAFACPVVVGDKTVGVIEFFTGVLREVDTELLETISGIAGHLGQFIERCEAEENVRRRERELSDFVENATIGLHWVGPDGTIKWANRAELDLLGYAPEEYIGHNITQFHASEQTIEDILRRLQAREKLHEYPAQLKCKDGSIRDVVINSSALFDGDRFVHTRCFTRDVTDRKRAEEALRTSEARFRALMEQAPFSVQILSPDGRTVQVNKAWSELWGVTLEDIGEYNMLEDPQLEAKAVLSYIRRAFAGEAVAVPPIRYDPRETLPDIVHRDDPARWVSAVAYPLKDDHGRPREIVLVHQDVTAQTRAEEGLRDADRRKDEFLATLAHELRNPLAPISNSLQILKMPRIDAATAQHTRDIIERQVQHLARLVDDLLDVSRVMRGRIDLRKEPVELATVITGAVETARPLIDGRNHRLHISMSPDSMVLHADPVRLAQVFGNLLTNAAKYTEPNGHIAVSVAPVGGYAVVTIRDDGIGIAPDVVEHIFELFVQADDAIDRAQGGLGIGLTLAKTLVEMHEGSISVSTQGNGMGSEFTVRLPLLDAAVDTAGTAEPAFPTASTTLKVLVVDDNRDAAESLSLLLGLQGHDVCTSHDGNSAIAAARTFRPHLVLLDIGMPGMNGYEVARHLRQIPELNDVVLAALTGWGQPEDRQRSRAAGFDQHLVKPVTPDALQGVLASVRFVASDT